MMVKITFTQKHLDFYGKKAIDLALLAVGYLVFDEVISEDGVSIMIVGIGSAIIISSLWLSYKFLQLSQGGEK